MSDFFEALQKIAKEEFGVTLIKTNKKITFKDLFGFDSEDIKSLEKEYVFEEEL